jgi:hypothetical protein
VSDGVAGECRKRIDAVWNIGAPDRAHREQIIEGQRAITRCDKHGRQHDLARLGALDGLDHLIDIDAAEQVIEHVASDPDDRHADRNADLMQDLLLAQKRDRPAYGLQHRHL